uniref:Uncharacterized protein n=1 Tax=Candidatus Kentrum sp. DK TaxID=2126562 RepID=A0A450SDY8_9GAMM|nr:MAG: hypothetical protein BECKDK2373C_GA0170839_103017 [Candidatus Kentron sp. DK]
MNAYAEKAFTEAIAYFEHASYKRYINSTLPNHGETFDLISQVGLSQLSKNAHQLYQDLTEDLD